MFVCNGKVLFFPSLRNEFTSRCVSRPNGLFFLSKSKSPNKTIIETEIFGYMLTTMSTMYGVDFEVCVSFYKYDTSKHCSWLKAILEKSARFSRRASLFSFIEGIHNIRFDSFQIIIQESLC